MCQKFSNQTVLGLQINFHKRYHGSQWCPTSIWYKHSSKYIILH